MLIEPNVRPAGAVIQPVSVRYGFGGDSAAQAATSAVSAANAAKRNVDMTVESARGVGTVQGT